MKVIIVPGLFGSQLRDKETKRVVWLPRFNINIYENLVNDMWGFYDQDKQLFVNFNGKELEPVPGLAGCETLCAGLPNYVPFVRERFVAFERTVQYLEWLGFVRDQTLLAFTYDWRQDVTQQTQRLLAQFIDANVGPEGCILLAHSMGGLVSRQYLVENPGQTKVKKLITLGTPFNGASAHGDLGFIIGSNLGIGWFNAQVMRNCVGCSACGPALCSRGTATENVKIFAEIVDEVQQNNHVMTERVQCQNNALQFVADEAFAKHSFCSEELIDKLQGRAAKLLSSIYTEEGQPATHLKRIYRSDIPDDTSTVFGQLFRYSTAVYDEIQRRMARPVSKSCEVHCVISTGVPTVNSATYRQKTTLQNIHRQKPEFGFGDGDGTVLTALAEMDGMGAARYYVQGVTHSQMPQDDRVLEVVGGIIAGK